MSRALSIMTMALILAAMMVIMAVSAFAAPNCTGSLGDRPSSCFNAGPGQPGFHGP